MATSHLSDNLSDRKYVQFDSSISPITDTEGEYIELTKQIFDRLIPADFKQHGKTYPTTHAKTLGIVKGKLVVPNNLPKHLKQGPFAKAGEYPVVMRYSFNNHDVSANSAESVSRGMAIKVFGLPNGERVPEGEGNTTQDFILNSQLPMTELPNAKTSYELIAILEKKMHDPKGAYADMMKRDDLPLQMSVQKQPKRRVESMEFYSQYAYRFGDYVAKFGLFPSTVEMKKLAAEEIPKEKGTTAELTSWIHEFFSQHEAIYD